jgi:hypothetical protein
MGVPRPRQSVDGIVAGRPERMHIRLLVPRSAPGVTPFAPLLAPARRIRATDDEAPLRGQRMLRRGARPRRLDPARGRTPARAPRGAAAVTARTARRGGVFRRARLGELLAAVLLLSAPGPAGAQIFFAARPDPPFTIGPLMIRAGVIEGATAVTVHVRWSLIVLAHQRPDDVAQDLYLLWPGEVQAAAGLGQPDAALAQYVEERGFSVVGDGRVALSAQRLNERGHVPAEAQPGGAPFVVFVLEDGVLGLSAPATLIRIPWTSRLTDRGWLMDLRLTVSGLVKPRKATWAERLFFGGRSQFTMSFNEVRDRPLFPLYFDNRDRVVRLAEAPAELVVSFAHSDRLKIDEIVPPTSIRRLSETEESTEVVSLFLDKADGVTPQRLSVQFGYFSRVHAWALVLIPTLFFALGQAIGPLLGRAVARSVNAAGARVRIGGWNGPAAPRQSGVILTREALEKIVPGETTRDEVLARYGPAVEQREQFPAADRRTLIYRGRRLVPKMGRRFGWVSTVGAWDAESHDVTIELVGDVVRDVHAQVRYSRVTAPESD